MKDDDLEKLRDEVAELRGEFKRFGAMIQAALKNSAPPDEVGPRLMTARAAGAYLAVSPKKLWLMTDSGEIPCARAGTHKRYDRRVLDKWIDRQIAC